jgi:hypothetical protein
MINKPNRQCNECYQEKCNSNCNNYTIDMSKYDTSSVINRYLPQNSQINYLNKSSKLERD